MTHWVHKPSRRLGHTNELTDGWAEELTNRCARREDNTDTEWFDLDSGCSIVLACDGGHKRPESSRYRLFHRAPTGEVREITSVLGSEADTKFETGKTGRDTYHDVKKRLTQQVDDLLSVAGSADETDGQPLMGRRPNQPQPRTNFGGLNGPSRRKRWFGGG